MGIFSKTISTFEADRLANQAVTDQERWRAEREQELAAEGLIRVLSHPEGEPVTAGHQIANYESQEILEKGEQ